MLDVFLAAALLAPAHIFKSEWRITDRRDPIEDTGQVYAVLGTQSQHVAIGCDKSASPGIHLVFRSTEYLGDERRGLIAGGRDVVFRFDAREPLRWRAEYGKNGVVENQSKHVRAVLEQVRSSTKLVVRALDYEYAEVDTIFTYSSPEKLIDDVLQRCASK